MSLQHRNSKSVLLFGRDSDLLEIRAKVLRSTGLIVEVAANLRDLNNRINAAPSDYGVIVCCHTATDAECEEVIVIADQNRIALLKLDYFTAPLDLIERVSSVILERRSDREGH